MFINIVGNTSELHHTHWWKYNEKVREMWNLYGGWDSAELHVCVQWKYEARLYM